MTGVPEEPFVAAQEAPVVRNVGADEDCRGGDGSRELVCSSHVGGAEDVETIHAVEDLRPTIVGTEELHAYNDVFSSEAHIIEEWREGI